MQLFVAICKVGSVLFFVVGCFFCFACIDGFAKPADLCLNYLTDERMLALLPAEVDKIKEDALAQIGDIHQSLAGLQATYDATHHKLVVRLHWHWHWHWL